MIDQKKRKMKYKNKFFETEMQCAATVLSSWVLIIEQIMEYKIYPLHYALKCLQLVLRNPIFIILSKSCAWRILRFYNSEIFLNGKHSLHCMPLET